MIGAPIYGDGGDDGMIKVMITMMKVMIMMMYSTSFSSMVKVVGALPTVQVVPWVVLLAK